VEELEGSGQRQYISYCRVVVDVFRNNIIFVIFVRTYEVCYYNGGKYVY
jgi:hypothetical protein